MKVLYASNVASLIKKANELGIKKNEIVAIIPQADQVVLVYERE